MRYLAILVLLVVAAAAATFARYESFSPCMWLEHDMARESDLPQLAIQAQIKASFLLDGVTDPTTTECLNKWWNFRLNGLPET